MGERQSVTDGDTRPLVTLPGGETEIGVTGAILGRLLSGRQTHFVRDSVVVRLTFQQQRFPKISPVRAVELASDFELVARFQKKGARDELVCANCSTEQASLLLNSQAFKDALPHLTQVSACAVLHELDGKLRVITGYDSVTGIYALGDAPHEPPLEEAVRLLSSLLSGFNFKSAGDRSRALAGLVTPALVLGDLLGGRCPIDLGEANASQAGKGYRNKVTTAIYGQTPRIVTFRRGTGSMDDAFQKAAIEGASFISIDNVRGAIDSQALESFLTEEEFTCRAAYTAEIAVDPRRTIVMMTSNKAETTADLANRSSCVRILKQAEGHQYQEFPEGDQIAHIRANQAKYLGAVFAVVRAWYEAGKPVTDDTRHDFRRWCQVLDWIVQHLFGEAPLMDGHRKIQDRLSTPQSNWLRDLAFAVQEVNRTNEPLLASDLLDLMVDRGLEIPGKVDRDHMDDTDRTKALQAIGKKLSSAFGGENRLEVEGYTLLRERFVDAGARERSRYVISAESRIRQGEPSLLSVNLDPWEDSPPDGSPNPPLVVPLINPLVSPDPPMGDQLFAGEVFSTSSRGTNSLTTNSGTSGDQGDQWETHRIW